MSPRSPNRPGLLLGIIGLGLLLRVLFLLKGASIYYGPGQEFTNGDSFSFSRSFINLWHTGHYTLEPLIPEASYGRLPGYPFFYGLHYLVWGPARAALGVAITQVVLDTVAIGLIYRLGLRWTRQPGMALLAAALYAAYPFAIVWVTVTGSESLNTFVTLCWLTLLTRPPGRRPALHYFAVGLLAAVALHVRAYMGLLLPVTMAYTLLVAPPGATPWYRLRAGLLVGLGFAVLYLPWPLRNYLNHGQLVLMKPASAGYANQREDMQAYLDWLHCWTNDNTHWVEGLAHDQPLNYPRQVFASAAEERRAAALTTLARRCGSSFYLRRLDTHDYRLVAGRPNCNAAVAAGFDSLRSSYQRRHPLRYWLEVPLANLHKGFFKHSTVHHTAGLKQYVQAVLFSYRTALVLLGVAGLWVLRRQRVLWPVAGYFALIYLYASFIFRSLEMRYLLQADVLLLLPAAWLLHTLLLRWRRPHRRPLATV